jgi:DNA-binding IclR family transcriptional regulator
MVKAASERKSVTVQSVERAVAALQVFFEEGSPVSVSEVGAATGLPSATVHRLLATLLKSNWITQDARSSRYELSEQMLGNAALAIASSPLLHYGHGYMTRLSEATGLSSYLGVMIRRGSVMLARVHGREAPASEFQTGRTLPLHASASGKLFLAFLPDDERKAVLRKQGELKQLTPNTETDLERLDVVLEEIRQRGYAFDRGELYEAHQSAAAPVRKADGRVVAALCVGGWPADAGEEVERAVLSQLVPMAEEFSRVYGQFEPW